SIEAGHPINAQILLQLAAAGIPMRIRTATGIEHWKTMIFDAQNTVYFGSANFSSDAFVPVIPFVNYVDETVYFTDNPPIVNSFRREFDDAWIARSHYADYANITMPLARSYAVFPVDPSLNFVPGEDFVHRTMAQIKAESSQIDVMMYRIVSNRAYDAMTAA